MFTSTLRRSAALLLCIIPPFAMHAAVTINGTVILDFDNTFTSTTGTDGDGLVAVLFSNTTGDAVAADLIGVDGTYSITAADGDYSIMITSDIPSIGDPADPPVLSANWANTSEGASFGDVSPDGIINLGAISGVTLNGVDFGIEQLPVSDSYITTVPQPTGGDIISTDGTGDNPSPLGGSDAEDGILGSGASLVIDSVPANATLLYAGAELSAGDIISNYNPADLEIAFTAASAGSTSVTFWFRFLDAAGLGSEETAYYTVEWGEPLPVTMSALKVVAQNGAAVLSWQTLSETNNEGFVIQRSENSLSWQDIGFLPSQAPGGNNNGTLSYEYTDEQPLTRSYYRLQQTDLDGKISYSNIVTLSLQQTMAVTAYPNPASAVIYVSGLVSGYKLQLIDMNGRMVSKTVAQGNTGLIELGEIAAGNYVLQVYDNGNMLQSLKVTKH